MNDCAVAFLISRVSHPETRKILNSNVGGTLILKLQPSFRIISKGAATKLGVIRNNTGECRLLPVKLITLCTDT